MLFLVKIKVKEGSQAEFERLVGELVQAVKAGEPGVLAYSLGRVAGSANDYWMIEHYADEAAHAAHLETPYFKAAIAKTLPMLEGAPEQIHFDRLVGA